MHSKVKQVTNKHRTCSSVTCIEAKDGTIIMEKEKILDRWVECIEELFEDNRKDKYMIRTQKENLPITSDEVAKAIRSMPKKKAPGPDDITIDGSSPWWLWHRMAYYIGKQNLRRRPFSGWNEQVNFYHAT